MNRNTIIVLSIIFVGLMLFTIDSVSMAFVGRHAYMLFHPEEQITRTGLARTSENCTNLPAIDLSGTTEPHLTKLSEYQTACNSFITNQLMIFTDMPQSTPDAKADAEVMANTLREFSRVGVAPLVIAEPVTEWGLIDFIEFRTGFYDEWIDAYFAELKAQGITDQEMGMWVPFPEANLPYWNHSNARPEDFSIIVNKYLTAMKKHFPEAKGSVLLNSATYDSEDFDWRNGEYISLVQFVGGIDAGLVDSFGFQGLPWVAPSSDYDADILNAGEFLNHRLAIEAADSLGIKNIWFNTGTFGVKYAGDSENVSYVSAGERLATLNTILNEAKLAEGKGYEVTINIFAEDKSTLDEATDWSYWESVDSIPDSLDAIVFTNFVSEVYENEVGLTLFDRAK